MFNWWNTIFKKKDKTNELGIKAGDRFYSEYFKSNGTVVEFINDDEWFFILDGERIWMQAGTHPKNLKWLNIQSKEENNETN